MPECDVRVDVAETLKQGREPWWSGRSVGELLSDPDYGRQILSRATPDRGCATGDESVAARLIAILRWGEDCQAA